MTASPDEARVPYPAPGQLGTGATDRGHHHRWILQIVGALLHESELARTDPDPQFLHRPMRYDIGLPSPVI